MVAAVVAATVDPDLSRAVLANFWIICGVTACWADDCSIAAARLRRRSVFGGSLVQLGDMLAAELGALLPAIQHGCQNFLEPLRLEQPIGEVLRGYPASPSGSTGPCSQSRPGAL